MTRFLFTAVLLWCPALCAFAGNDETYVNYLNKNGLKVDECVSEAPGTLFQTLAEREKLGYAGTPANGATTVNTFYQKYLAALQPYNDSHFADVAKARQSLRDLFYYITDAFEDATRNRTYITHKRVDALVEHFIVCLAEPHMPAKALHLDLSVDDAAAYLRARLVLIHVDGSIPDPDFDAFRGQIAAKLRRIGKEHGGDIQPLALHYYAVTFADDFRTPLDPIIGAPE
jgi:hypothetical protein